jgi:hypothetical protein
MLSLLGLTRDRTRASSLGDPAGAGTMHLDLREEGKLFGGFGEGGNMAAQANQALLQAWGELPRQ